MAKEPKDNISIIVKEYEDWSMKKRKSIDVDVVVIACRKSVCEASSVKYEECNEYMQNIITSYCVGRIESQLNKDEFSSFDNKQFIHHSLANSHELDIMIENAKDKERAFAARIKMLKKDKDYLEGQLMFRADENQNLEMKEVM